MRRTPLVSVLAVAALLGAGCGLTDDGPRPGIAAEVDGERLGLDRVDEAVEDYCALRAGNEQLAPTATALIRAQFVVGWVQAVAVEALSDERDLPLPADHIDPAEVEETWGGLGEIDDDSYDSFEWLTWIEQRLTDPVAALGSDEALEQSGEQVAEQEAVAAGSALITRWLAEEDVELNPVFGDYDAETGIFSGDRLSVPVSDEATTALDTAELTADQVADLPAAQRCGAAAEPALVPEG